jgi:pyrroloquinoline quinone biosynthesis protein E
VLLYPEGVLLLNESAATILSHVDGVRTVGEIIQRIGVVFPGVNIDSDVHGLLDDLVRRRLITVDGTGRAAGLRTGPAGPSLPQRDPVPMGLLAELTYRCPLHCTYCANPVEMGRYRDELDSAKWLDVLDQARVLGVWQLHLSGGEPLLRPDLGQLIAHARRLGLYTNLVTSGIPLTEERLHALAEAGLDHVQLSIQDSSAGSADRIAGAASHQRKLRVAGWVTGLGLPLTVNVVLHRANLDRFTEIAELAVELGADRIELAHSQFYGWALRNHHALMPTADQILASGVAAAKLRQRYGEQIEFVHVAADYHSGRPKPCMNGWGSRQLVVAPNGDVLPCLAASQLAGPDAPSVRRSPLADAWYDSALFNRFRGTEWLPEPCQSCALREVDLGGCRCQAYQLTGDPAVTDPACDLSPHHHLILERHASREPDRTGTPRRPLPAVPRRMR